MEKKDYLIGKQKRFNPKLFEKYDVPARKIIKKALGNAVSDNPDIYQQDLIINSKCRFKYLEIQVCTQWISPKYPYDTVCLYARKMRYGDDTLFLTLNKFFTRGLMFHSRTVDRTKPRRLKKYSREYVYDVPWNCVIEVYPENLDELTLELI